MVRIEKATLEHIALMSANVRKADRQEIFAAGGMSVEEALTKSIAMSGSHFTGFIDDKIVCMFGIGEISMLKYQGIVWLIGTNEIEKHKKTFMQYSKGFIEKYKRDYSYMYNFVDSRNKLALAWLKWLGFKINKACPYGYEGRLFHKVELSNV